MSTALYSGPGWYRVKWHKPGESEGTTRAVYIGIVPDIPDAPEINGSVGLWLSRQSHEAGEPCEASCLPTTIEPFIVSRIGLELAS